MTEFANPGGLGEDDATVPSSFIRPAGLRRRQPATLAFNATPVVDLVQGEVFAMILTGNIVPGAPLWGGAAMPAGLAGAELMFEWVQDGTGGRTITYSNSIWSIGASAPAIVTTLSTRTLDLFYWDGVKFRLISRVTG